MFILSAILILLGSDDFDQRENITQILSNSIYNKGFINTLKYQSENNQDLEIQVRCEKIIYNIKNRTIDKILSRYIFLPQIDMCYKVGHNGIFTKFRSIAVEKGYKSKKPLYAACRYATYLYFKEELLKNKDLDLIELQKEISYMYFTEFKWYLWIYFDLYKYDFPYWTKPK